MRMALIIKLLFDENFANLTDTHEEIKCDKHCDNPHCILTTEQELEEKFYKDNHGVVRCLYCDSKVC